MELVWSQMYVSYEKVCAHNSTTAVLSHTRDVLQSVFDVYLIFRGIFCSQMLALNYLVAENVMAFNGTDTNNPTVIFNMIQNEET